MRKTYTAGFYWLVTLSALFVLLRMIASALMNYEVLMRLFAFHPRLESARDMSNRVLVLGMRPCTVVCGVICAAMYNFRSGHVLLAREGVIRYGGENILACLLCGLVGGIAGSYYLLSLCSLGFTMLIIGVCIVWVIVPLLAVFGLNRMAGALRGDPLYYPRPGRVRARTLTGAFRDVLDWNSRPLLLVVSFVFFSSLAMLMNALLEGPLNGVLQAAVAYAAAADKPIWEAFINLTVSAAPFLPMVSSLFCTVFFNKLCSVLNHRHPAVLLLAYGPIAAVMAFAALIVLVVAGAYSVFLLLIIFGVILLFCSQSKDLADDLYKRMLKRRRVMLEESLTLKIVLIVGFAIPLMCMFGG